MTKHKERNNVFIILCNIVLEVLLVFVCMTVVLCNSHKTIDDCQTLKLDLVIIVDTSTSVGESNFILGLDFVRNILKPLPIGPDSVRVALLRYSTDVKVVSYMNEHMTRDEKIQAVSYINYIKGLTYTNKVLQVTRTKILVLNKGDRSRVKDLVILITDGQSTKRRETVKEAILLKNITNLKLFTIGVTKEIDEVELMNISSSTHMSLFIENFTDLNNYLGIITPIVCSGGAQGVASLSSAILFKSESSNSRTVHDELNKSVDTTLHIPRTSLDDCEGGRLDVVVILDTSKSVGADNFLKCITFIENLLKPLHIESEHVRVALVRYSTDAQVVTYLNENMSKEEKIKDVSRIEYIPGATYTNLALQVTSDDVLTPEKGDRPDVSDLIILITDGESNEPDLTEEETNKLKQRNDLRIFTIGIGKDLNAEEVEKIATNESYSKIVDSFNDLSDITQEMMTTIVCLESHPSEPPTKSFELTVQVSDETSQTEDYYTRSMDQGNHNIFEQNELSTVQVSDEASQTDGYFTRSTDQADRDEVKSPQTLMTHRDSTGRRNVNEFTHSMTSSPGMTTNAPSSVVPMSYPAVYDKATTSSSRPDVTDTLSKISNKPRLSSSFVNHFLRSSSSVNFAVSYPIRVSQPRVSHSIPSEATPNLSLASITQPVRPTPIDPCGLLLNFLSYPDCQKLRQVSQQNWDLMPHQPPNHQKPLSAPFVWIDKPQGISLNFNFYNYNNDQKKFNDNN